VTPAAAADVIFALGDGFAMRILTQPERDFSDSLQAAIAACAALFGD
jgi:hypothetical protein